MKTPKSDTGKISLPGEFGVIKNKEGVSIIIYVYICVYLHSGAS